MIVIGMSSAAFALYLGLFLCTEFVNGEVCVKGSKVVSRRFVAGIERDFSLTGPVLSNITAENKRECELECHLNDDCGMFNYYPSTKVCELLYRHRSAEYKVERKNGSLFRAHNCLLNLCGHTSDPHCARFCILPRSCSHAKSLGFNESRNYKISPDTSEANAFQVFCDMRDKGGVGVTVVSHDSEDRTYVPRCIHAECYRREVHYDGISDIATQLGALTIVSSSCEQYINYECYASLINDEAWLESRDGRRLNYWAGAPPGSKKCACGVAGNCVGGRGCNCDSNKSTWLKDDGFMTHKEDLPITALRAGDVNSWYEKIYHTIGKLKCYGQAPQG